MSTDRRMFRSNHAAAVLLLAAVGVMAGACDDSDAPVQPERQQQEEAWEPLYDHASDSALPHIYQPRIELPASLAGTASIADCSNSPGPEVTLDGSVALGGLNVELTFQNNEKGTHTRTDTVKTDVTVLPSGEEIVIPKQPVHGGTGGNPFIWVQLVNADGEPVTDEVFLGRCVQGPFDVDQALETASDAFAEFAITGCENSPGPYIDVGGELTVAEGLSVRFIFRNNDNPVDGPHEAEVTRDIDVIAAGETITFPKQPVEGGVGGNPWIYAAFTHPDGTMIGEQTLLGRCVQLDKELSSA